MTIASTGTGKTSGPVITNALTHPGQLIVIDIKGEVHAATARRRREMGQEVHVLDLRDGGESGSLNPLDLAARSGTDVGVIARSFAAELVERSFTDRFWDDWTETMVTAAVAWFLADRPVEERRMSAVFDLFTVDGDVVYSIAAKLDKKEVTNRVAYAGFRSFLQLPEKETRPSVLGTTISQLRLFDSDLVRHRTNTTSINLDGLVAGKPMSLYIIVPPYRLAALRPLLRLWLSGLLMLLTQRTASPPERTLVLCDEIGNLGKIEAFLTAATLMRGYGVTLWSFWQNPAQMEVYGPQARTLIDNAGVIQCFGVRNHRMAQEFAGLVGGVEPDTLMGMAPDEQILLIEGGRPRRCRQVRYYNEPEFGASRAR